jgi:hypothetical protein
VALRALPDVAQAELRSRHERMLQDSIFYHPSDPQSDAQESLSTCTPLDLNKTIVYHVQEIQNKLTMWWCGFILSMLIVIFVINVLVFAKVFLS